MCALKTDQPSKFDDLIGFIKRRMNLIGQHSIQHLEKHFIGIRGGG